MPLHRRIEPSASLERNDLFPGGYNKLSFFDLHLIPQEIYGCLYLINGERDPGTRVISQMTPVRSRECLYAHWSQMAPAFYLYLPSFLNLEPVLSEVTPALHKVRSSELRCDKVLKIKNGPRNSRNCLHWPKSLIHDNMF